MNRQHHINHHRNYCVHYNVERGKGCNISCAAGMDIKKIQRFSTGGGSMKWGPCIEGHLLDDPISVCSKWERRSLEDAQKYANGVEQSLSKMAIVGPAVIEWRKKLPIGKQEVIECPACKGRLHLRQSSYNGHVHGKCETADCVAWME